MPGGVWNEDELPVLEWEAAEHRVVLPESLQRSLGINVPVLRWDREKYTAVAMGHHRDRHVIQNVSRYMAVWAYHGEEIARPGNMRVLFQDEAGRWYAASLGPRQGEYTFITLFGGSDQGFRDNRLRGMHNVVQRDAR